MVFLSYGLAVYQRCREVSGCRETSFHTASPEWAQSPFGWARGFEDDRFHPRASVVGTYEKRRLIPPSADYTTAD